MIHNEDAHWDHTLKTLIDTQWRHTLRTHTEDSHWYTMETHIENTIRRPPWYTIKTKTENTNWRPPLIHNEDTHKEHTLKNHIDAQWGHTLRMHLLERTILNTIGNAQLGRILKCDIHMNIHCTFPNTLFKYVLYIQEWTMMAYNVFS